MVFFSPVILNESFNDILKKFHSFELEFQKNQLNKYIFFKNKSKRNWLSQRTSNVEITNSG